MHQIAVLPTELVGTYSCHGIDSNQDKINQDAACICYPLTGHPHTAVLIVVDGHGELGHDVTQHAQSDLDPWITARAPARLATNGSPYSQAIAIWL